MSEALMTESGSLLREVTGLPQRGGGFQRHRSPNAVQLVVLPAVEPGQLWYVELPATEPEFSPLEYQALTAANVVIYDRALAPTVARFLPLGGYAEPAPSDAGPEVSAERCLGFARDCWSVARLIDPGRSRIDMVRQLSKRFLTFKRPANLPVVVFANAGGGAYEKREAECGKLRDIIDELGVERYPTLTVLFPAFGTGVVQRFSVASANGLAG